MMQKVVNVLKGWYPTSVLPEPEFATKLAKVEAQEALRLRVEEQSAEIAQIVSEANKNGIHLKAPNGKPTNLTEHQWALVRTKAFKQTFGDWERAAQITKLLNSEPIVATGEEWRGKYELNRHSARKYIKDFLRYDEYKQKHEALNRDTGLKISVSISSKKVVSHKGDANLKAVALIPQIIEHSVYLGEEVNVKRKKKGRGFTRFRYYAVGLKLGGADYTVRLTTGVGNGETYYDHSLTQIKKEDLIDWIAWVKRPGDSQQNLPFEPKDDRLISLLQGDFSRFSNTVDENGEPNSPEVEAFENKYVNIQSLQVRWVKQDNKIFGWFNPNTNAIVLCEGHNISTASQAFWHATFLSTKTNAPKLYTKMVAYAQSSTKSIKDVVGELYPELKVGSIVWTEKLGAMRFVMDYADKIEESLNNEKSLFAKVLRVFGGDRVNLVGIGRRPPEKAVAALANAFASGKHPAS